MSEWTDIPECHHVGDRLGTDAAVRLGARRKSGGEVRCLSHEGGALTRDPRIISSSALHTKGLSHPPRVTWRRGGGGPLTASSWL